ncbi:MAG: 16S rRNA (cytidine(1402)-2'-O)-methyltransferase [Chloroflexi bacterium]|nr:16S rRNA (cytidine(1402)-2'-O)-methyltransferase [Chloroflexota bacterium]
MPILYVVATPIGNLEDITLRALRVLRESGLIAAEDTRTTRRLLQRYGVQTPLTSYHEHNKLSKLPTLLDALREKDVALVSDAGMPGINDPGYELVDAALQAGIRVVPVPGASAITAALAVAGVTADQFVYLGFLPRRRAARKRLLESLNAEGRAIVAFEAPHRLRSALTDLDETLGERRIAVCRELTKLHEEVFRGTASEALQYFVEPRGEFTLVIEGGAKANAPAPGPSDEARSLAARFRADGLGSKKSVSQLMKETGLTRREAYRLWLESAGSRAPQVD